MIKIFSRSNQSPDIVLGKIFETGKFRYQKCPREKFLLKSEIPDEVQRQWIGKLRHIDRPNSLCVAREPFLGFYQLKFLVALELDTKILVRSRYPW